jgi:hypothetical protein
MVRGTVPAGAKLKRAGDWASLAAEQTAEGLDLGRDGIVASHDSSIVVK